MRAIEVAIQVAKELGDGWKAEPGHREGGEFWRSGDPTDAYLNGPNGEPIYVTVGGYQKQGRITLGMSLGQELYQHYASYGDPKIPDITVAETKTAAQIARDVERRLLPTLRELLKIVRDRKAKHDEAEQKRAALMELLLSKLGPGTEHLTHNGLNELRAGEWGDAIHATVKVLYGCDVEFQVRVSSEALACALAASIGALRRVQ